MTNEKRDQYLTEQMGGCWHKWPTITQDLPSDKTLCKKCGLPAYNGLFFEINNNFSTWAGFGKLWEWVIKQEWFDEFADSKPHKAWLFPIGLLKPDSFADAVYKFLNNFQKGGDT